MSNYSETFGRLLKGAINSIAAYEGRTAPVIEGDLGTQIGVQVSFFSPTSWRRVGKQSRALTVSGWRVDR